MADLDDFFAKKDKKKKEKPKAKFVTAEELVKNLEDSSKREAAVTKARKLLDSVVAESSTAAVVGGGGGGGSGDEGTLKQSAAPAVDGPVAEAGITAVPPVAAAPIPVAAVPVEAPVEEEWKEVVEENQRKDYTGLKIGQMTLNDEEDGNVPESDEEDVDSDGNPAVHEAGSKRSGGGPWKKVIPAEEVTQIPMEMEKPSSKAYVSPGMRHSQLLAPMSARMRPSKRIAPDITNADYFPTLGAARPEEQRKKKNEPAFEEVRHGGRMQRVKDAPTAQPTAAGNRFQSLDEDES